MRTFATISALTACLVSTGTAQADPPCATPEQARQVQAFYKESPAAMPVIAGRKLGLPETAVVSGLPASESAGTTGDAFTEVWSAMTQWQQAIFLITKGDNIFEIVSAIAPVKQSTTSKYTNIAYEHPLRGHLRPDQYASIYAVAMPGKDGVIARGVLFYDASGASVFGAFLSGEGPPPPEADIASFDRLMAMIRARAPACPASTE
jgi:putative heme iron utilization protein